MNKIVKTISMDPDLYERIAEFIDGRAGLNFSKYMSECAELYLDIAIDSDELIKKEMRDSLEYQTRNIIK